MFFASSSPLWSTWVGTDAAFATLVHLGMELLSRPADLLFLRPASSILSGDLSHQEVLYPISVDNLIFLLVFLHCCCDSRSQYLCCWLVITHGSNGRRALSTAAALLRVAFVACTAPPMGQCQRHGLSKARQIIDAMNHS